MATTSNLYVTKLDVGQAQKETTVNEGFDAIDRGVGGKLTKSVAGSSNVTLTTTEAQNAVLEFTGALTGSINVDIPSSATTGRKRAFLVYNNTSGAYTLTVRYSGGTGVAVTQGRRRLLYHDGTNVVDAVTEIAASSGVLTTIGVAVGDETTAITTGTAKVTFRMPHAMTLTAVRASLTTASTSGIPTFDINEGGTTILSTKLTIDANELTSTTAAAAPVISDTTLADDAQMTIDIDVAGTGAKGPKIWLIGYRT